MNKESAIEKAKKLLAMAADSSSPNEAAIAARQARSIIDKFQINDCDLLERGDFATHITGKNRKRVPVWEQTIAIAIAKLNDCIAVFNLKRQFVFKGFDEDALVAKFMLTYLVEACLRNCKTHMKESAFGNHNDFKCGFAAAIEGKVEEILKERRDDSIRSTGKNLIVIKKSLVEERFGKERYSTSKATTVKDPYSYWEGVETGKKTNLVTGVGQDTQPQAIST